MSERQLMSVALYIPWSTAAVALPLPIPTVNGAVSSDEFSTSNRRGGRQRLVIRPYHCSLISVAYVCSRRLWGEFV